jgi:hypothetical protein
MANEPWPVSQAEWEERIKDDPEADMHPCDHWCITECLCKGACSCHWSDERSPEAHRMEAQARAILELAEAIEQSRATRREIEEALARAEARDARGKACWEDE